jgi:hypothetical protein
MIMNGKQVGTWKEGAVALSHAELSFRSWRHYPTPSGLFNLVFPGFFNLISPPTPTPLDIPFYCEVTSSCPSNRGYTQPGWPGCMVCTLLVNVFFYLVLFVLFWCVTNTCLFFKVFSRMEQRVMMQQVWEFCLPAFTVFWKQNCEYCSFSLSNC